MNTPEFLVTAERIAREAHAGQLYGDKDYVEAHVGVVANIVRRLGYGALHQAAAWLHDTVEDTNTTLDGLMSAGMPLAVVRAVGLLSKRSGHDHHHYLSEIGNDPVASVVKYADSSANFASTMLLSPHIPDSKFRERAAEYQRNMAYLRPRLPEPGSPV